MFGRVPKFWSPGAELDSRKLVVMKRGDVVAILKVQDIRVPGAARESVLRRRRACFLVPHGRAQGRLAWVSMQGADGTRILQRRAGSLSVDPEQARQSPLPSSDSSQFPSTYSSLPQVFGCSNVAC